MNFKEWFKLQEVGTSTSAIAVFARPTIGMVKRSPVEDKKDKKKK